MRVSAATIRRLMAGRLGPGGGPGSAPAPGLFPPEPQVLQEGEGQQAQERVVVQAAPAPDSRLEPALATSWKLVNPTSWRFELRQGVRFHDGSLLTAEDVAFSINRALGAGSLIKGRLISLE